MSTAPLPINGYVGHLFYLERCDLPVTSGLETLVKIALETIALNKNVELADIKDVNLKYVNHEVKGDISTDIANRYYVELGYNSALDLANDISFICNELIKMIGTTVAVVRDDGTVVFTI